MDGRMDGRMDGWSDGRIPLAEKDYSCRKDSVTIKSPNNRRHSLSKCIKSKT